MARLVQRGKVFGRGLSSVQRNGAKLRLPTRTYQLPTHMVRGIACMVLVWAVGAAALRLTLAAPQRCGTVTSAQAFSAATGAADWIERAQKPDGSYIYEYNVETAAELPGYDAVRHAGVTMGLYYYAALTGDDSTIAAGDAGLRWMQGNLVHGQDWAALKDPDGNLAELGGTALMLAGLEQRRVVTGDAQFDPLIQQLGQFLLLMQEKDGSMTGYFDTGAMATIAGSRSLYFTGEAFWALTMMETAFPGEGWDSAAERTAAYIATQRDDVEDVSFPPWSDQWAAYGLAEMTKWTRLSDAEIGYARSLAERYGFMTRYESQRRDDEVSKLLQGPETRAAGTGTWLEALDSLWRISKADPRLGDIQGTLGERVGCAAAMLVDRQITDAEAANDPHPQFSEGAWARDSVTRMDDQQHALAGLLRARAVLEAAQGE